MIFVTFDGARFSEEHAILLRCPWRDRFLTGSNWSLTGSEYARRPDSELWSLLLVLGCSLKSLMWYRENRKAGDEKEKKGLIKSEVLREEVEW